MAIIKKEIEVEVCDECGKEDTWAFVACDICGKKVCRHCRVEIQGVMWVHAWICRSHLPAKLFAEEGE